jgi:pimeloyl-ACP methyl ester carboxylesterase
MTAALATTTDTSALREGYADLGDVTLHYLEAGEGPLVLLLHGFPEFSYGWRLQIEPLAAAGYHVVAPDLRGYNLSSRPDGVKSYSSDKLADDVSGLIHALGEESAIVVGHDWGGTAAWATAMKHPEVVERLAILDAAHPRTLSKGLVNPRQQLRSWYFFFFALPWLPERIVQARNFRFFRRFLRDARPGYTPEEMDRYVEAWSKLGALTAMIDYYRFSVRQAPWKAFASLRRISAPTMIIWGQGDRYLGPKLTVPDREDVPNLVAVHRLPGASHWVHHDEAARVNELLVDFFDAEL